MIRLEIRHRGVMSLCVVEDKTDVVVVVASYRSVSSVSSVSRPCDSPTEAEREKVYYRISSNKRPGRLF